MHVVPARHSQQPHGLRARQRLPPVQRAALVRRDAELHAHSHGHHNVLCVIDRLRNVNLFGHSLAICVARCVTLRVIFGVDLSLVVCVVR